MQYHSSLHTRNIYMLGSLGGEYENSIHYGPKKRTHKHANTVNPKRFTHCERKKLCFNRTKVRIAPRVTEKREVV